MQLPTVLGSLGVGLLLLAFLLNLRGRLPAESPIYSLLNLAGAVLAGVSSFLIDFLPFVILEGVWALAAAVSLARAGRGRIRALGWILGVLAAGSLVACGGKEGAESGRTRGSLAWSPNTAELLFISSLEGNADIFLAHPGDSAWTNLTRNPAMDNWPEWSPDGTRIAFQSNRAGKLDIWSMAADGSDLVQLTDDPDHDYLPAWSPDGKRITFTSWRQEPGDTARAPHVYVMNADGSGERRLIAESLNTSSGATWSPDGSSIVFSRRTGEDGADVYRAAADGSGERRLTEDPAYEGAPVFSPDGARIAFYVDAGTTSALAVMNADGSGRRIVLAEGQNWYPRWSPDGRWLVYTAAESTGSEKLNILAVPAAGGEPVLLFGGPGREAEGRWRPSR